MLRNNSVWNRNQTKKKFNPVLFVKFQGIRSQVRWPERPETLAHTMLLKQNRLHWLAQNYHSEDAANCYFQSASQQRGMKRAESQREQRLSFIRWKQQPLTEERVLFATSTDKTISLYIFVAYISQLPGIQSFLITSVKKMQQTFVFHYRLIWILFLLELWLCLQFSSDCRLFKQDWDRLHMFTFGNPI